MNDRYGDQNYYEILELTPSASTADVYAAYQRARATYSPSSPALYSMFSTEEAQELLRLIEEAYQTLSNQSRRRDYDVKIGVSKMTQLKPRTPHPTPASTATGTSNSSSATTRPSDSWVGPVRVLHAPREDLPAGHARTKFSTYKVDSEIEREIQSVEEVDGAFLQRVRLYRGVTLEQLSDEIRVIKTTIVALEANDLKALPVAVFTRGFVVQIARALGLNERKISDAYMKFFRANKDAR